MRKDEALDALEQAEAVGTRARSRGRWYTVYAAVFGVATLALVLVLGLFPSPPVIIASTVGFGVVTAAMTAFAVRQPVHPRGHAALHLWTMGVWGVLYTTTLFVGMYAFPQDPAWWVPAALACAAAPLAAAYLSLRRSRSA
ncbi:hypothetical protein CQJ94_22805 [Glycomyces fuscus]|nr:hypothetical protein CQJ94_22805 [Glycomyces fuscus]